MNICLQVGMMGGSVFGRSAKTMRPAIRLYLHNWKR